VVEKADILLNKGDAQLLGRFEDGPVVLAASRSCDVLDTRASRAEDVVDEWKLEQGVSQHEREEVTIEKTC
jgi:hypothetical protein